MAHKFQSTSEAMTEPEDKFCRMFVRFPMTRTESKQDNLHRLEQHLIENFHSLIEKKGYLYTESLEIGVAKNPGYDENGERNGRFMDFYYMLEVEQKPNAIWKDVFDSVCDLIVHFRKLGGNAIPACDYEEEIYRKIGTDPQIKLYPSATQEQGLH